MKRILYLDKEFMDSYISQIREGLPGQHTYTNANKAFDAQVIDQPTVNQKVSGQGKVAGILASGEIGYEREMYTESRHDYSLVSEGATEAITLLPHDNALKDVIELSGATTPGEREVGKFLIVGDERSTIYDIRDIVDRLDDESIRFIAERMVDDKIKRLPNPNDAQINSYSKNAIRRQIDELKQSRVALEMTCKFAQFDVCVLMGDTIAPLKRECMRTSTRDMIFKYNTGLHVFGQITRKQAENSKAHSQNPVELLNDLFNGIWPQALQKMGILPEGNYWIIDPMAVYFE